MEQASSGGVRRSTFVYDLAKIFIILAGLCVFVGIFQVSMFPKMSLEVVRDAHREVGLWSPLSAFPFDNLRPLVFANLVMMTAILIAAIGLLKRKNWARIAFIWIMALGILFCWGSLAFPFVFPSFFPPLPENTPADVQYRFDHTRNSMTAAWAVMAVGLTVLFGWIIKKLVSRDIKAEFGVG